MTSTTENDFFDKTINSQEELTCAHCGLEAVLPVYAEVDSQQERPFCCHGCLYVYDLLNQAGASDFYRLRDQQGEPSIPRGKEKGSRDDLLDPVILEKFCIKEKGRLKATLYIEGIQCQACLWLIQKFLIPAFSNQSEILLDADRDLLTFYFDDPHRLKEFVERAESLGFTLHLVENNSQVDELRRKNHRKELLRIGVAGAAAMNAMFYAVSVYVGAEAEWAKIFNWLGFFFSLPAVTFSAYPFYSKAWTGLKNGHFHLDLPLSLAILGGMGLSLFHLLGGGDQVYFDSLSILIFLILFSRYLVRELQSKTFSRLENDFSPTYELVEVIDGEEKRKVAPSSLSPGVIIALSLGDTVPADAVVTSGEAYLSESILTGEYVPQKKLAGELILAGSKVIAGQCEAEVSQVGEATKLGKIFQELKKRKNEKVFSLKIGDLFSHFLVRGILLASALTFVSIFFTLGVHQALERTLAVIIVACPCAFGMSIPLGLARRLWLWRKEGIFVKDKGVIERLTEVKNVAFDKTGTLTSGEPVVKGFEHLSIEEKAILYSLESKSDHPIATALVRMMAKPNNLPEFDWYQPLPGVGIKARRGSEDYFIGREVGGTTVFRINDKIRAEIHFYDRPYRHVKEMFQDLRMLGRRIMLVTGDKKDKAESFSLQFDLDTHQVFSEVSPNEKLKIIQKNNPCLFIGDGVNDAPAFTKAHVSLAAGGSVAMALKASDIFIKSLSLSQIPRIIREAESCLKTVKRAMIISLSYNILGVSLALFGFIGPLEAAILMPLSGLCSLAFIFSQIRGEKE